VSDTQFYSLRQKYTAYAMNHEPDALSYERWLEVQVLDMLMAFNAIVNEQEGGWCSSHNLHPDSYWYLDRADRLPKFMATEIVKQWEVTP
jgi:hypothetical protein